MNEVRKQTLIAATSLAGAWIIYKILFGKPKSRIVGKVTELYVHPLKSGRGIKVESAYAGDQGLIWNDLSDRSWCVRYARNNVKVSAREEPSLFKINIRKISDTKVEFFVDGFRSLQIDLTLTGPETNTHIFGDDIDSEDIGDEAATWISDFLGKECRISFRPRNRHLSKSPEASMKRCWRLENNLINDKDLAGFQDGYPYLMLGEDSLADINEKITHKTYTMRTFRPNIVIQSSDGKPWAEDNWKGTLQIGNATLSTASPCPRCVMTTVDPETMEKDKLGEPLKSLASFRQAKGRDKNFLDIYKKTPLVGMNVVILKTGKISVGDDIILNPN